VPWIVGSIGLASAGAGTAFGILALKSYASAKSECPAMVHCSTSALDARSRATLQANVANVTLPVGVAGLGAATVLFLVMPRASANHASVALLPAVGPNGAGLSFTGVLR
jgi:hypothetical protein